MRSLERLTSEVTGEEFTLINDRGRLRMRVQDLPRYAAAIGAEIKHDRQGGIELHDRGVVFIMGGFDGTVSARALEGWGRG